MTEGIEILDIPSLTKRILDHWEEKRKEALLQEKDQRKKLNEEVQKENSLKAKLETARSISSKMQADYSAIEIRIHGEKRAMIETAAIREQDVKSGKITLSEFLKKGKTEKQIYDGAVKETMKEMGQSLQAIRKKNLEILNFERELLETQTKIRYMIIEPGRILQKALKDLIEFSQHELGYFLEEVHSSKYQLEQVKGQLLLTEGKSLGPGYSWSRISIEQAYKLQFDPIIPLECIAALKSKLESFKDSETVNVTYFLRTRGIDVTSISFGGKK